MFYLTCSSGGVSSISFLFAEIYRVIVEGSGLGYASNPSKCAIDIWTIEMMRRHVKALDILNIWLFYNGIDFDFEIRDKH